MRALIIGGGIGGAAAALALRKSGIQVRVHEQAAGPSEVAAGVSIWGNALRALTRLGVGQEVIDTGEIIETADLKTWRGKLMSAYPVGEADRALGMPSVVIHRQELLGILHKALGSGAIHFGSRCVGVEQDQRCARVRFEDGHEEAADIVVGADGLSSAVRNAVIGRERPRYAGYTSWRGILDFPECRVPANYAAEVWGRGQRFGITRIGQGRVYWWATRNAPANGRDADPVEDLLQHFGKWYDPIPDMIWLTPRESIIRTDIMDRVPSTRWGVGRVTLAGDAAHCPTPNLGQGCCMAIEDGLVLARTLAKVPELDFEHVSQALRAYEEARYQRTAMVTKMSWRLGWVGQWSNPVVCAIRDLVTAWTPRSMFLQNHRSVVGYVA